ncbi:type II toxin-antitoxin system RelE/ParE family toxin [uncultured Lactobacillus sp.]|uniref:type II toxin-antitoxin system RelE/ParE family toxin n=1 Tax=uncultured Lactobacillus sp. TaxID=153152 RepID=UPI00259B5554|nr:type II toxin-antitoxin system RelE/ParE family toxin [uncultured Lactobacillus sp.]
MFEFEYYDWNEFSTFLKALPLKERTKFAGTIAKIEDQGLYVAARQRWTRKIDGQIHLLEIRSKFSSNIVRAPFFKSSDGKYVITHGFKKKSQKMPKKELDKALKRRELYEKKYGVKKHHE